MNMKQAFTLSMLVILSTLSGLANAACSVHDHNCFHGAYSLNPAIGIISSAPTTLNVTTAYGDAGNTVDLNQHVALPQTGGSFIASGSDGNPIEVTPLGGAGNVLFHAQNVVIQTGGGPNPSLAVGSLATSPGTEQVDITGAVAEGTYEVAVYNYDENDLGNTGAFATTATATGTGHFDAPNQSHIASALVQSIDVFSGALAPDQQQSSSFAFYDEVASGGGGGIHAQGLELISTRGWNPYQYTAGYTGPNTDIIHQMRLMMAFSMLTPDQQKYQSYLINRGVSDVNINQVENGYQYESYANYNKRIILEAIGQTGLDESGANKANHAAQDRARELSGCTHCSKDQLWEIYRSGEAGDEFKSALDDSYYYAQYSKKQRRRTLQRTFINAGFSIATGGALSLGSVAATLGTKATVAGILGYGSSGGDLGAGLAAALSAGALGYSASHYTGAQLVGAHAVIGCAASEIQGGKCADGAASAAAGKLTTLGIGSIFDNHLKPGQFNLGQAVATVGAGYAIGGDAGGIQAALGYGYNWLGTLSVSANSTPIKGGEVEGGYFYTDGDEQSNPNSSGTFVQTGDTTGFGAGASINVNFFPNGGKENLDNASNTKSVCAPIFGCANWHSNSNGETIGYGISIGPKSVGGGFLDSQNTTQDVTTIYEGK